MRATVAKLRGEGARAYDKHCRGAIGGLRRAFEKQRATVGYGAAISLRDDLWTLSHAVARGVALYTPLMQQHATALHAERTRLLAACARARRAVCAALATDLVADLDSAKEGASEAPFAASGADDAWRAPPNAGHKEAGTLVLSGADGGASDVLTHLGSGLGSIGYESEVDERIVLVGGTLPKAPFEMQAGPLARRVEGTLGGAAWVQVLAVTDRYRPLQTVTDRYRPLQHGSRCSLESKW